MNVAARLDDLGKPAWIASLILAFILFWPLGLALLAYLIWSGRMGCWTNRDREKWKAKRDDWMKSFGSGSGAFRSSGNAAFDEYKKETLRRLEEEQREFLEFIERLRKSKDKAEFDQFMAERASRAHPTPPAPEPA
jgi:hypothetical protein